MTVANDYSTGQTTGITTTAKPLTETPTPCNEVMVQGEHDNDGLVRVGVVGGQYLVLDAKDSVTVPISDVSHVYVKAVSGTQKVNWIAR